MSIEDISKKLSDRYSGIAPYIFPRLHRKALSKDTTKKLDEIFFCILKEFKVESLIECGAREASASQNAIKIGGERISYRGQPYNF